VVKEDKKGKLLIHKAGETPMSAKTEKKIRMPKVIQKIDGFQSVLNSQCGSS